jgi:hypothetical protein
MKNTVKSTRLSAALNSAGIRLFRCESCNPHWDAVRNLEGRTHYVDERTLKYFKSKILNGRHTPDGLLFWLVESVQSRPDHGGFTRRAVIFDVFGEIVNEHANHQETQGEWFKETSKAEKSASEFLKTFDAVAHTAAKLEQKSREEILSAKRTLAALRGK